MARKSNPDEMLKELAELDKRLAQLQKFFRESKSMTVKDSLFTPKNIEEAIRLLEKINPSEKAMIQSLKMLLPLSKQDAATIEKKTSKKQLRMSSAVWSLGTAQRASGEITTPSAVPSRTSSTAKLKGRLMPGRMI